MGGQLVSVDSPVEEGGGKAPFTKIFWSCLPSYLAMGMTEEQYFRGDPALKKAYRKSWKIRQKYDRDLSNYKMWLMGGYVYQAMVLTAPTFNSIKPHKPMEYLEKPFDLEPKEKPKENPLFEYMKSYAERHNKQRHARNT